ncbi:MAG TPA: hypothetical protein VHD15_11125 [Hyphomicrobiales bacterium]|nr:hypothetical protein [Hyphomicrobiales bacterium]
MAGAVGGWSIMDKLQGLIQRGMISELKVRTEPYQGADGHQALALVIRFGIAAASVAPDEIWTTACQTLVSTASGVAGVDRAILEIDLVKESRH